MINNDDFFDGRYKHKTRVVHSAMKADVEERMIKDLLEIESFRNPTEIVIHVNMLKEGWDVRNLYTIIPLRAANSKTLIEQSVGRGLRLPFGRRTGVTEVDRLTIVSHDRFDEIVNEANKPDSIIRAGMLIGLDVPEEGYKSVEVQSRMNDEVNSLEDSERATATKTIAKIDAHGSLCKEDIVAEVLKDLNEGVDKETARSIALKTLARYEELTIAIPRIHVAL